MEHEPSSPTGLIAAERRRKIHHWTVQYGSVTVAELAEWLGVGANTVRRDLDALHQEGKVVRAHGGAVTKHDAVLPDRIATRQEANKPPLPEEYWIAEAALAYVPSTGTVFISGGTARLLAAKLTAERRVHVVTNSLEVATLAALKGMPAIDFLGGAIRLDSLEADCGEAVGNLYWDVAFLSFAAIDVARGITEVDRISAGRMRALCERTDTVVGLCDTSRIGRTAYSEVGPVSLLDVLITNSGISPETAEETLPRGCRSSWPSQPMR